MHCRWASLLLTGLVLAAKVPAAPGATCYAITTANQVITFQTGTPSTLQNSVQLTGLGADTVIGCDIRPSDGKLYLVTTSATSGRIYTVNPSTGAATLVAPLSQSLSGIFYGVDFDPVSDLIRVISDTKMNVRINPTTGAVITDSAIGYAAGDPNAGQFPAVFGCAYSNNFTGANSTTLYGVDAGTDSLVRQDPANDGLLHTVGSLGIDFGGNAAFDIAPSPTNHAFAALPVRLQETDLFLIDLATGHASRIGDIGTSLTLVGFSVAPGYPHTAFSRQQKVRISSNGVGYQELNFNYETGQIAVSPYFSTSADVPRFFPFVEWTGVFHYDYGAGAFTQAIYTREHPL